MKRGMFFFGLGLLVLAFIAGAAEIATSALSTRAPLFTPWHTVWATLWPTSLAALRAHAEGAPWAGAWWLAETLMELPGWLLFGAPGFTLMLVFRDRSHGPDIEHIESLGLYDALARRAHDDGFAGAGEGDDMAPDSGPDIEAPDATYANETIEDRFLPERKNDNNEA